MRLDPVQPLQHFKALDRNPTQLSKMFGKNRCPDTVSMQNGSRAAVLGNRAVQERLSTRRGLVGWRPLAPFVDDDKIVRFEVPFIFTAGGNQNPKRLSIDDDAIVAACSERPASGPEMMPDVA